MGPAADDGTFVLRLVVQRRAERPSVPPVGTVTVSTRGPCEALRAAPLELGRVALSVELERRAALALTTPLGRQRQLCSRCCGVAITANRSGCDH